MHLKKMVGLAALLSMTLAANANYPDASKWSTSFKWKKSSQMPKLIKQAQKRHNSRKVANFNAIDLSLMSTEYKGMVEKIINADSADKIAKLISELEPKLDDMPADAKFLGTQLVMLKPFRGLIYRMIPLVEKEKITHSYLRNQVKIVASNMRVYLPMEHWEAGFEYMTEPYLAKNGKIVTQFDDDKSFLKVTKSGTEKFQDFVGNEVYEAMATAANRIETIDFSEKPMVWDNKASSGKKSFKDDFEDIRYRNLGEAERYIALSSLHFGMHYLNYLVSYNIEGSLKLSKDIGKLYGIDGFFRGEIEGVPSYKWVKKVNSKSYENIGKLRKGYKANMALSYDHLKEGVRNLRIAREELRNESASRFLAIDPAKLNAWDENIERQFKHIECLTNDQKESTPSACPIRSAVTGHTVIVDLKGFYMNPPNDLKAFLPTSWDTKTKMIKKHGKEFPNYKWGTPTQWNVSVYKKHVFPQITSDQDIPKYVRTLRQAFGGEAFGVPMAIFVE
ncbi:hypothetical protein [Halobacteriovorax sp. HLS]|uniref:hypothetical protein n=1 Tax=Halobacteriovorax sp. HLS TaxID=2234000 RepID=UPI000FD75DE2|nr:hypothetical protein [Halobacteriovorax sp. HLS]